MEPITPRIRFMSNEELYLRIHHSRGLMLEHMGNAYFLNAGTSDRIYAFKESIGLYVLTVNRSLGYVGLDAYMPEIPEPINTVFLHVEQHLTDALGTNWEELSPRTIATRLIDYLI